MPATVWISVSNGCIGSSITECLIAAYPPPAGPTSAKRATEPATATPRTASVAASRREVSPTGPVFASTSSSGSGSVSHSIGSRSESPANEYANSGPTWPGACVDPTAGAIAVASPADPTAGAIAVASPADPTAGAIAVASPADPTAGAIAVASPADPTAGAIAVASPADPTAGAIAVASPASPADMAAPRASAAVESPSPGTRAPEAARPIPDSAVAACDSDSTATSWTPESSNARRSWSARGASDQYSRVAISRWFSSANNRFVPTTVSINFSIGLPVRSTTDSSITSAPPAPDPTSAKRAAGPVTATPKTTSIPAPLRLATPQPASPGITTLPFGRQRLPLNAA